MGMNSVSSAKDYCNRCCSILPFSLLERPVLECSVCGQAIDISVFNMRENTKIKYYNRDSSKISKDENGDLGSKIERTCEKCGNGYMYFIARQIRGADEGQTVFYTCTAC